MIKLTILLLALLASPVEATIEQFTSNVDTAYQYYTVEIENNSAYEMVVVKGVVNDKCTYGIAFASYSPQEYYITVKIKNVEYTIPRNERGDYQAIALDFKGEIATICIYNRQGKPVSGIKEYSLAPFTKEEFLDASTYTTGTNAGVALTKIKAANVDLTFRLIVFGAIIITVICAFVVIFLLYTKRGIFAPQKRKEGVFDMRSYIDKTIEELNNEETYINDFVEAEEVKPATVYTNPKKDFEEDVEIEHFDVKTHLQQLGFSSDYQQLTDDEKNQVMIELMKLKDNHQLSRNQYLEETYNLWKK